MTVDLSVAQSITFIIISILLVIILIKMLQMVHHQTKKVKELEMRMKAMEGLRQPQLDTEVETEDKK
jgi:membrane protein implicated in regulation of membrane protease activity